MKTLTNWSVVMDPRNPYLAPELQKQCLAGQREEDLERGTHCTTSFIVGKTGLKESLQRAVVTNSGTRYMLLEVDPEYEARYPNALFRLMDSLTEVD